MTKLCLLLLLFTSTVTFCQMRPCFAFAPSDPASSEDKLAKDPLEAAITLSGDYDFFSEFHGKCWTVHVVAMSIPNQSDSVILGYAVSYSITDPDGSLWQHGLNVGPDKQTYDHAMRRAAVSAVQRHPSDACFEREEMSHQA
jgi:hypothetical protein